MHAFWSGFTEAGGGKVLATEVTHRDPAAAELSAPMSRLASHLPDFVFGLYSGLEAVSFMQTYESLGFAERIPLLTTPLMLHGHWAAQMGRRILGVRSACAWVPGTNPEGEARFIAACEGIHRRPAPDYFALLGYEAGQILRAALDRLVAVPQDGEALRDAMAGVSFSSARGHMRVDEESGDVLTADHLVEARAGPSGAPEWSSLGPVALPDRYAADAMSVRRQDGKRGWINAYLVN